MSEFKHSRLACAVISIFSVSFASSAYAEDGDQGIEKIEVTATKRTTGLQDTAIAMSAFTGETLKENGVSEVTDIATLAPGVSITQNSANVIVSIRGVNSQDTNETGNPAVAIAQDSFYIERANSFSNALYDMQRVEVLRGPQGTLYGKNATGGVINFITNKPTSEQEGSVSVGIGNYNLLTAEGMLNVPVTDEVNMRAAFFSKSHDGYRENEAPATPGDDADMKSGRVHLSYAPSDDLSILLSGQWTDLGGVGATVQGVAIDEWNNDEVPSFEKEGIEHSLPSQKLDHFYETYQVQVDYSLDFMDITLLSGLRNSDYSQRRDLDGTARADRYMNVNEDVQDVSHELRFSSNTDNAFSWQFGGNYFNETNSLYSVFESWAVANSPDGMMTFDFDVETTSKAAFIHTGYKLTETLELEAGLRRSKDEVSRKGQQDVFGTASVYDNNADSAKTTHHLGLNWKMNEDTLLYVKSTSGYKAGGFNNSTDVGSDAYSPETLDAIEVGLKSQFFDNSLRINSSAFTYKYKDQQVKVTGASGLSAIENAGESKINGLEVEFVWQVTSYDRVDGSVVLLDGEYEDLCLAYSSDGVCATDYAGNETAMTPDSQFNLSYEHEFLLDDASLVAKVQTHYESESFLGIENFGFQSRDAYTKTDLILTYYKDDWNVRAYIRNIEDDVVITSANKSSLFGTYNYGLMAPRTFGASISYIF